MCYYVLLLDYVFVNAYTFRYTYNFLTYDAILKKGIY